MVVGVGVEIRCGWWWVGGQTADGRMTVGGWWWWWWLWLFVSGISCVD